MNDIYDRMKSMVVGFALRPGDRLNESALSKQLGVSRTPLREVLNRLVAEGHVEARPGEGFFCRKLDAQGVHDLYDLREILELAAVGRACRNASDEDLKALENWLVAEGLDVTGLTVAEACERDETFHVRIAELSGNPLLVAKLKDVNEKIRYLRWVQMDESRLKPSKDGHRRVMQSLLARDEDAAVKAMRDHITRRFDQINDAVSKGISNIFMDQTDALTGRILKSEDAA
ncbi:GntR family transcriptional regulator [Roseibium sp.]|uniref:GntR family transcriptional regulator n=1 Tax=Roseibium sp. TaxID=1936156 RepID=UPI0039EF2553